MRRENKETVVHIETGHVPPDEARMGARGEGREMERSFGPTRHVSQPNGDKHPLDLRRG